MTKSISFTMKVVTFILVSVAFGLTMIALSVRTPSRAQDDGYAWGNSWEDHSKKFEKQFSVQPDGKLIIDTDVGEISITGTDKNEVSVVVTVRGSSDRLRDFDVEFSQDGNTVTVSGRQERGNFNNMWGNNSLDARFVIQVPKRFNSRLSTSGGGIAIDNITGTTDGETSGGDINLTSYEGAIDLTTSGGDLEARKCSGKLYLKTSGGNVRGEFISGTVEFETSGGNIELREIDAKLHASTSGGNIHVEAKDNKGIELTTSGGNVVLLMPKSVTATVEASTSSGDVSCELEYSGKIKDGEMHGRINGGGNPVRLETSGGDIEINPL